MDSHEYAALLQQRSTYLLTRPKFDVPSYTGGKECLWYMWVKEPFLAAVKALGPGKKIMGADYVEFHPTDAPITVKIERNKVCTLVEPAKYDCTPLLSQIDELSMVEEVTF